eukprot:GHVU01040955.1.p1 GENE.GHVU01040955.1~~GHVU01040955.1.p1  ORF type:complete len:114 (-),score=2.82 GHVU01040955.1:599-940(-)
MRDSIGRTEQSSHADYELQNYARLWCATTQPIRVAGEEAAPRATGKLAIAATIVAWRRPRSNHSLVYVATVTQRAATGTSGTNTLMTCMHLSSLSALKTTGLPQLKQGGREAD